MGQRGKASSLDLRMAAVRAVVEDGVGLARAAKLFGVSKPSVWRWVRSYRDSGEAGLK